MRLAELDVTAPYSLGRTIGAYARFPEERVNIATDGRFRRCLMLAGEPVLLEVSQPGETPTSPLEIETLAGRHHTEANLQPLVDTIGRMLAFNEPIEPVYELMEPDPRLRFLKTTLHGMRRTREATPFEGLIYSILAQLISIRGAAVVRSRLVERFGQRMTHEGDDYWAFPEPDVVQQASVDELCKLGMTGIKARAILAVAEAALAGELELNELSRETDEDVIRHLTALPGIGRWTAEWFLVKSLGRMTIVPAGDLGIRRSTGNWLLNGALPSPEEVRSLYEPFGDLRAYIAYYVLSAERYQLTLPET